MTCPICDQKPMNCDCSPRERAMYEELQKAEDRLEAVTLTDAEREAIDWAAYAAEQYYEHTAAATLRGLLERTK